MGGSQVAAFAVAFASVFLAELPDKTMFASLVLTTRYRRPFAVWSGVVGAFALHVAVAVAVGSLIRELPTRPVRFGVAALFLLGGVMLIRSAHEADATATDVEWATFGRVALVSAAVVGLAEFGDLTQLATAGIAARYSAPLAVALGAWCALAAVAALAVWAGRWIALHVRLQRVRQIAGIVFILFAALTGVAAIKA